jgi:hypothetical protein
MDSQVTIKTSRCEPYPLLEPQGYVVGFTLYANENGHSIYKDVFVSFADMMKAEQNNPDPKQSVLLLDVAYKKIEAGVKLWLESVTKSPAILGSVYTPPPPPEEASTSTSENVDAMQEAS